VYEHALSCFLACNIFQHHPERWYSVVCVYSTFKDGDLILFEPRIFAVTAKDFSEKSSTESELQVHIVLQPKMNAAQR